MALAHTRLSILGLSADANQPMYSKCGRYALSYNGEIYNFIELRAELEALGVLFSTDSDTEVLLQCWIRWGGLLAKIEWYVCFLYRRPASIQGHSRKRSFWGKALILFNKKRFRFWVIGGGYCQNHWSKTQQFCCERS